MIITTQVNIVVDDDDPALCGIACPFLAFLGLLDGVSKCLLYRALTSDRNRCEPCVSGAHGLGYSVEYLRADVEEKA